MKDRIYCSLIDDTIEVGDCVVYSDVSRGMFKESCIPDKFKKRMNGEIFANIANIMKCKSVVKTVFFLIRFL